MNSFASINLSLTFNCDGVPVFKSSRFSIWPILCVVNELPVSVRANHILIAALWFGSGKPDMTAYLEPFVNECRFLTCQGFEWHCNETGGSMSCTARVVTGICDAVARPMLQNFKQFNAHHGCSFCFDHGESIEKGNGRVTVYPFKSEMMLRSVENVNALIAEAVETSKPCLGIIGPSLLSLLPQFDIVHGMVPDYMHCICLGVVRQMARLWFDSKNHNEPFYIGKSTGLIDRRLLAIKPPCSLSRTPRSIV
jgi:Transposase family tnp2